MAKDNPHPLPALTLGALGVVFGDIGTSPLYAISQCFRDLHAKTPPAEDVLGILSLVFWSIMLVVCVKYVTFVLRADFNGEGGTLALLGLLRTKGRPGVKPLGGIVLLVFFGSALLYGDGVITPSISVLSAVEGLKVATPAAQPYIVPICAAILAGLFLIQQFGTGGVGRLFGPVMAVWFLVIGVLGGFGIARAPQVLQALNPLHAVTFLVAHGFGSILVLGAVVLAFSGVEALFADLGHFGRGPIRLAWYGIALPALIANYFGQGALILTQPALAGSSFFGLVPKVAIYPMVGLATLATIIASQAVISGAFSLTQQAIHLGYLPPMRIRHTSETEEGQIYVGPVNWALMIACLVTVFGFQSSDRLTSAYGLALSGTMTVTTVAYFLVLRRVFRWKPVMAWLLCGAFLIIDLAFLMGNLAKIISGAWYPLTLAAFVFSIYWIWTASHARYKRLLRRLAMPIPGFVRLLGGESGRQGGTAIFLTSHEDTVPLVGKIPWLRQQARHHQVILVTVAAATEPRVADADSSRLEHLGPGFFRISTRFGFMQEPDISRILSSQCAKELKIDWDHLVCFIPEPKIILKGSMRRRAAARLFDFMLRNSLTIADYFQIPARQIVHVGVRLEL
jgi:KUP system potassium uptake protein